MANLRTKKQIRHAHTWKIQRAKDAIDDVFSDTHVSRQNTKESLEELKDEIEMKLSTLRKDDIQWDSIHPPSRRQD